MSRPMNAEEIIETYTRVGAAWAKQRDKSLFEKRWLDRFYAAAPRHEGPPRILDLGCGSGRPIATYLAERGARLCAVDASPTMVDLFSQNLPKTTVMQADMRTLALDDRFDGILAWDSFFHLSAEDQRGMFAIFACHAAPQAALMFTSGPEAGEAMGQVAGAPIYHASLAPDEYRGQLLRAGFEVIAHTAEDPACHGHTIWLARATA